MRSLFIVPFFCVGGMSWEVLFGLVVQLKKKKKNLENSTEVRHLIFYLTELMIILYRKAGLIVKTPAE